MKITDLYSRAIRQGCEIDWFPMRATKALSLPDNSIALNPSMIEGETDEKTTLAHELGHCVTGSFYSIHTPLETRARCEFHADKRAIEMLIPLDELRECFRAGCQTVYEVAQYFDVSEQLVERAMELYEEKIMEWKREAVRG